MLLRGLKWFFAALSVGSVVVAAYFMLLSKPGIQQAVDIAAIQAGSSIINPDIKEYDGENLNWRLQAEKAEELDEVLVFTQPDINLFSAQREEIPIKADKGLYNKQQQMIHFEGDVKVVFQGWTLTTLTLDFDQAKDEIKTRDKFVMQQQGIKITGKDLYISRKTEKLKVSRGVHMVLVNNK